MSKHWDGDEYVGNNIGTIRILYELQTNENPSKDKLSREINYVYP